MFCLFTDGVDGFQVVECNLSYVTGPKGETYYHTQKRGQTFETRKPLSSTAGMLLLSSLLLMRGVWMNL